MQVYSSSSETSVSSGCASFPFIPLRNHKPFSFSSLQFVFAASRLGENNASFLFPKMVAALRKLYIVCSHFVCSHLTCGIM